MVKKLLKLISLGIFLFLLCILINGDDMEEEEKRCDVVGHESAMKNIHIDSNSKEGKLLVEVINKESSLKKMG